MELGLRALGGLLLGQAPKVPLGPLQLNLARFGTDIDGFADRYRAANLELVDKVRSGVNPSVGGSNPLDVMAWHAGNFIVGVHQIFTDLVPSIGASRLCELILAVSSNKSDVLKLSRLFETSARPRFLEATSCYLAIPCFLSERLIPTSWFDALVHVARSPGAVDETNRLLALRPTNSAAEVGAESEQRWLSGNFGLVDLIQSRTNSSQSRDLRDVFGRCSDAHLMEARRSIRAN